MANENRISIVMSADGTAVIESVEKIGGSVQKVEKSTASFSESMKSHWLLVAGAAYAAYKAITTVWDSAMTAAQIEEQKAALDGLVEKYHTTTNAIIASLKEASNSTVSTTEALGIANKGLMMSLDPQKLVSFMKIAKATSDALGIDTATAFDMVTSAAASGQTRMLKHIGIVVNMQKEYSRYAMSIGKTVDVLTEEERQTAGVNAVLVHASSVMQRLGESSESTKDKMEQFEATLKSYKKTLGEVAKDTVEFVMWLGVVAEELTRRTNEGPAQSIEKLGQLKGKLQELQAWQESHAKGTWAGIFATETGRQQMGENIDALKKQISEMEAFLAKGELLQARAAAQRGRTAKGESNADELIQAKSTLDEKNKLADAQVSYQLSADRAYWANQKSLLQEADALLAFEYSHKKASADEYYAAKSMWEDLALTNAHKNIKAEIDAENAKYDIQKKHIEAQYKEKGAKAPDEVMKAAELEHTVRLNALQEKTAAAQHERQMLALEDKKTHEAMDREAAALEAAKLESEQKLKRDFAVYAIEQEKAAGAIEAAYEDELYNKKLIRDEDYFAIKQRRIKEVQKQQQDAVRAEIAFEEAAYQIRLRQLVAANASEEQKRTLLNEHAATQLKLQGQLTAADNTATKAFIQNAQERGNAAWQMGIQLQAANDMADSVVQASANIHNAANKAMEKQMLSLVETGKFSASAFAQAVIQQVKMELIGLAARAAVWAIFFTAMGIAGSTPWGAAIVGPGPAWFAAAAQMALVSGGALVGAMAVQSAFGGTSASTAGNQSSSASSYGASTAPIATSSNASSAQATTSQNVTVQVYALDPSSVNWQKITEDNIVPAINNATDRNIVLKVRYA
ncbi:hypothetical protein EPN18_00390 [bacterium]|nr:MAG: hypothetical protein EPN18_00390 [bacterium]